MKWEGQRQSDNVEDRRGEPGMPSGGRRLGGGRGIGLGTIVIALVAGWIFGINPLTVLSALSGGGSPMAVEAPAMSSRVRVHRVRAHRVRIHRVLARPRKHSFQLQLPRQIRVSRVTRPSK